MDIHKPKSWHGWREFLKEFATIVLGVSVALAAEQGVEWLHWRSKVSQARITIANEMASNVTAAITRMRGGKCVDDRLDALAKILDAASLTGRLPPVGYIAAPPVRGYIRGAWESIVASETASHFPADQMIGLGGFYGRIEGIAETARAETEVWSSLSTMTGPGRRLDPASEAELRKALALARTYNRTLSNGAFQFVRQLQSQELPFSPDNLSAIAAARDQSLTDRKITARDGNAMMICQPIGPVPPEYGHFQFAVSPDYWEAGRPFLPGQSSAKSE